jgi:thioredoxin reductase (NADPH)
LISDHGEHWSRTVVICAGLGAYTPRTLEVDGLKQLKDKGVFHGVEDIDTFRGKRVLIVGGGDAAVDHALMLEQLASEVTLIHRNSFFCAHEDSVAKLHRSSANLCYPFWTLGSVKGDDRIRSATIKQSQTGEQRTLEIDALMLNIGFDTELRTISEWGLNLHRNAILVDNRMRTSIDGVYAAGDIATYDGKLKLISTGCGEVAIAVNNAKNYIDPRARVNPGHSTERHVKAQRRLVAARMAQGESAAETG